MIGEGYLLIQDYQVLMLGEGDFSIVDIEPIEMIGIGEMSATSSADYIFAQRPPMQCILRESAVETCDIYATRPITTAALEVGIYEPPAMQYIYAVRPPATATLFVETSSPVSINAVRPAAIARMADHEYSEIYATRPARIAFAQDDPTPRDAQIVSVVYAFGELVGRTEHIIFINSSGQLVDTITGTKEYIAEIISTLNASSSFSGLGGFNLSILSVVSETDFIVGVVGDGPQLDPASRVWVVNIENESIGQYDNYGYLSFYTHEGKNYGVAEDGIYELTGSTDNGVPINAIVDFGKSNLTSLYKKRVTSAYLGVSSTGKLLLTVEADGQTHTFEEKSSSNTLTNQRFNLGSSLSGYYWNFVLKNQNGDSFDLDNITFEIMQLNRRI